MGQPAAKQGDHIQATDTHIVIVPGPTPTPQPLPHPFNGIIDGNLSPNVRISKLPAATVDSTADNTLAHIPTPPGASFQKPPTNTGTIKAGSRSVRINGKAAARNGDAALTCNDPADALVGTVVASGKVTIG